MEWSDMKLSYRELAGKAIRVCRSRDNRRQDKIPREQMKLASLVEAREKSVMRARERPAAKRERADGSSRAGV